VPSGWTLSADKEQILVLSSEEADTPIKSISSKVHVPAPIKIIMMFMSEADLLPSWMPSFLGLKERRLTQLGLFRKLLHIKIWVPWPFKDHEMVFNAMGCDVIEGHSSILVVVRSYDAIRIFMEKCTCRRSPATKVRIDISLARSIRAWWRKK
jgi:hypothetical protein